MKTASLITSALAVLALAASPVRAAVYTDPGGIGDFTGGNAALDMSSVVVNNDANNLYFTINVGADPTSYNWTDYLVGISEGLFGGVGGNLNGPGGWGQDLQMSVGGMDYFVGAYPYWGTGGLLAWNGALWNNPGGPWSSQTTSSVTVTVPLASIGLASGGTFQFDVWTHSSGNGVFDALSDATPRSWGMNSFDTGANALTYTAVVPEPTSFALLGLGGLLAILRRKVSVR